MIQTFLTKHGILQVLQAPYSPDMATCDFWLFPKINNTLKGSCFESCGEIMQNMTAQLHAVRKEAFQYCFQRWKDLLLSVWHHKSPTLNEISYCNRSDIELFSRPKVRYFLYRPCIFLTRPCWWLGGFPTDGIVTPHQLPLTIPLAVPIWICLLYTSRCV